jgi:hypothetical protein
MADEAAPLAIPTFDDLADSALDVLELCRRQGLLVGPETALIEMAMKERNCARLEKLIARVNAKLQADSVEASSASQGSAASAAIAPHYEPDTSSPHLMAHYEPDTSSVASLATFPAVPAYHVEPRNRRGPKPRPHIQVATACVSSSRPDSGRDCKYPALRKFVYEQGLEHLKSGTLNDITMKSIVQKYKAAHPEDAMPNTIHACFQWDTLHKAVMNNDMTLLTLQRHRAPTRNVFTMEEKLLLRPDLEPVVAGAWRGYGKHAKRM